MLPAKSSRYIKYSVFCAAFVLIGSRAPARDALYQDEPAIVLSRTQNSQIAAAQARLVSLEYEVARARESLLALQRAALPGQRRTENIHENGASIGAIVNVIAIPNIANTVGFERKDKVAFVHRDDNGELIIGGLGEVSYLKPDELQITITAQDPRHPPRPEDKAYVINRADSPYSLTNFKFQPVNSAR